MNAFDICLSLVPLAIYFLLLGIIHASRRPFIISGDADMALLSAAVSGMVFAGPINLFFPLNAAIRFGTYIWLILAFLYFLITMLVILYSRPRLIVYNIDKAPLKEILEKIASRLDENSTWAGDSLYIPQQDLNLHLEFVSGLKNVTIVSNEKYSSRLRWRNLKRLLKSELKQTTVSRNGLSIVMFSLSAILFFVTVISFVS
ncbi:MAG: hypothetical protein IKX40_04355 [Thermoguttaceae bacterium]|nr:hypothetical protein [Thermoguttaceae bacterium]